MILLVLAAAAHAACGPAPLVVAAPLGSAAPDSDCAFMGFEIAGRAFQRDPHLGLQRGIALVRARGELGVHTAEDVQVRVAFVEARSGSPEGDPGVAGESWVPVLQVAEARYDARGAGLAVAAGLVDDLWVMTMQPAWGFRDLALPLATDRALFARTDEGAWTGFTSTDRLVSVSAAVQTGEGANAREQNEAWNVGALAVVRPLARSGDPDRLSVGVYARQGARGPDAARDHRTAAAVILRESAVVAAVEGALGWGFGGDPDLLPAAASAWARTSPTFPAIAWARGDVSWATRIVPDSRQVALLAGAGPQLPIRGERKAAYVAAGLELRRYEPAVAPRVGTTSLVGTHTVFLQLGSRLGGVLPFGG